MVFIPCSTIHLADMVFLLKVVGRANTDYSNPSVRELLLKETKEMVSQYKNTPGLLLFLLGNENNYGLFGVVQKLKIFRYKIETLQKMQFSCINCLMMLQKK
jgi:beta-galactosidase/beta-glucuronidase